MEFINFNNASEKHSRQNCSNPNPIKTGLIRQAKDRADRNEGNIKYIFYGREWYMKNLGNCVHNSVGGGQNESCLHAQKYAHSCDKHREDEKYTAEKERKIQFRYQKIIEIR